LASRLHLAAAAMTAHVADVLTLDDHVELAVSDIEETSRPVIFARCRHRDRLLAEVPAASGEVRIGGHRPR
jgi:hypothetical protein